MIDSWPLVLKPEDMRVEVLLFGCASLLYQLASRYCFGWLSQ